MKIYYHDLPIEEIVRLVDRPDPVFLEIGSAHGNHSQQFLDAFPDIRLFCFEPDPRAIARHRAKIKDPRCTLVEAAVSDTDGQKLLYMSSGYIPPHLREEGQPPDDWDMSSSLHPPKAHLVLSPSTTFPDTYNGEPRRVVCRSIRLDTWFFQHAELSRVDFIWADTQGSEADIIEGAARTLPYVRYFYTEFSNKEAYEGQVPLVELQKRLPGFDLLALYGGDPNAGMESNALFRRHDETK